MKRSNNDLCWLLVIAGFLFKAANHDEAASWLFLGLILVIVFDP